MILPSTAANICMLVHKNYYRDGRVRRYTETLAGAGNKVDVLCVPENDISEKDPGKGITVHTIPMIRSDIDGWYYIIEYGIAFWLYTIWLIRLYFRNRYKIIHVHNMPDFFIFTAIIPKMLGAKLILDIHDPMPEFYMSKFNKPASSWMIRIMEIQEKLSTDFADSVITANHNFKNNLVARGIPAEKIAVVHNIPDFGIFDRSRYEKDRGKKGDNFTLIFPGTMAPRYGLDLAVRALPQLISVIPNICLLIIGQRVKYTNELENLAQQLGVYSYLKILPTIPVEEIPRYVMRADVGIYPAFRDPHMDIAVPSKVLEFAILGVPIVASNLTVLKELFSDKAMMFFESGNVKQFADCIQRIYQFPSLVKEMVKHADVEFVRKYDFHNEQMIYFEVINALLKSSRSNKNAINE